jgi:hypothetical protein
MDSGEHEVKTLAWFFWRKFIFCSIFPLIAKKICLSRMALT